MNTIKKLLKKKSFIAVLSIVVIISGYYGYKTIKSKATPTRYVLSTVEKGTLITSVSGSGQISASSQVDIKPKASADIISVPVSAGQIVKAGTVIAQLDTTNALKTVRDAQANLDSARLSLQKLQEPTDSLSLLQAKNALAQAQQAEANSEDDLKKAYDDGFNSVSNAFLDLPTIISGLQDILYSNTLYSSQENIDYFSDAVKFYNPAVLQYRNDADTSYQNAKKMYDQNFADYKATSRNSDTATIETLINETHDTAASIAQAIKDTNNLLDFYQNLTTQNSKKIPSQVTTYNTNLDTYTSKSNSDVSSLLSIQTSIKSAKNAITNADSSIQEKTQALAKLQAGTDPLDIQSQELNVQQRQNALLDARQTLADYNIRSPFDGILASLNSKKDDSVSAATTIATVVTQQQIADISLNEVDAAKVQVDQKATLTFDAIEGLNITGHVAIIDTIGTVTSGVVTYNATIALDTQDNRIKPGMSVTASIITDTKTDVLMVPNSAVKTSGSQKYVQMLDNIPADSANANSSQGISSATAPQNITVTVGASNDSMTEIASGLKEDDQVVARTITSTTTATPTTNTSIPGLGGTRNSGGTFRLPD